VKHIAKAKSMLTEELELREHLENAGIKVVETDVGEWIVQLAGEKPVHLTGPAIHKTIGQVAELFSKATGEELEPDPQVLLNAARRVLRQSYIDADMGISGVNIAIAETGTVVIVTNEGNGCLVTSLPPIYVAVVGSEKLVSSFEDANAILRLLSTSTMGMKTTVYVSYITGPSSTAAIPGAPPLAGQGPSEVHIVLVDNGREQMRSEAEFREALYCIKCGACLGVCPVFGSVAGHTYGYIYQGGIGAILTAFLHGLDKAKDVASLCMGCLACNEVCPARIDMPHMISELKAKFVAEEGLSGKGKIIRGVLKHPKRLDWLMRAGSYLQQPFTAEDSMIRRLPYPLNELTQTISLPALSRHPLPDRLRDFSTPREGARPRVAFYAGCVANYAYPDFGEDVMKVLRECGTEPYYPLGHTCCGAPAFFTGDVETALSLAKVNIAALEEMDPDYIVTVCAGCAVMLQQEYPRLTAAEPEWNRRVKALSDKIRDFSQLVLELTPSAEKKLSRDTKVTYHDPCHLKRGMGIYNEPRQLLEREGFELVELARSDVCCGFGCETVLDYPELSNAVLQRKLDNIEATGVDTVITNCLPCILQIRGGFDKRKDHNGAIKVMHTAELMAKYGK
jgi:iron-sulfur cluster protein